MTYRMPTLGISGLLGKDLAVLGIPTEEELVRQYCARTKRSSIEHLNFYLAFSLFRYAGILHGIRGRVLSGTATSSRAREYASHVEVIAELGWVQARCVDGGNRH